MAEDRQVQWNDAGARRAHANECNVSTRVGEFVVSFGVSQAPQADDDDLVIALTQNIVLTPQVAKRLAVLLDRVLREHESRYEARPRGREDSHGTV